MTRQSRRTGLVSFAGGSPSWRRVARRFRHDALLSQLFHQVAVYDDESLKSTVGDLRTKFPFLFGTGSKGFGFWIWKPIILLDFLDRNPSIDQVVYVDAGSHFNLNSTSRTRFTEYLDMALKSEHLFMRLPQLPEIAWTAPDVIAHFDLSPSAQQAGQIIGGVHFWNNSRATNEFLNEWLSLMLLDEGRLVTDRHDISRNGPFIQHRHDQSVLSCLAKSRNATSIPDETDFYPNFRLGVDFPVWTVRNPTRFRFRTNPYLRSMSYKVDWGLSAAERQFKGRSLQL